ncbi:hypothetical protein JOD20_000496 [Herpetosiphon giganteus]|nr:hypothetical protein [Herpetosiphon giganteus]
MCGRLQRIYQLPRRAMLGIIKRERTCCLRWYFLYRSEIIAGFVIFVKTKQNREQRA